MGTPGGGYTNRCETREEQGYRIVKVAGEVDLSWSSEIRAAILAGLDDKHPVLVDLASVAYIDSSGIASFVEGYQRARQLHLQFGLLAVSLPVLAVLRLARLETVFPLHADITAARAAGIAA
jgi:anti-sigma B factor antagonist